MSSLKIHIKMVIKLLMGLLMLSILLVNPTAKTLDSINKSSIDFVDLDIEESTDSEEQQENTEISEKELKTLPTISATFLQTSYKTSCCNYNIRFVSSLHLDIVIPPPESIA